MVANVTTKSANPAVWNIEIPAPSGNGRTVALNR